MDIILFLFRTSFLVLIYVFIFVVLIYLVKDLNRTGEAGHGTAGRAAEPGEGDKDKGVLAVESAPGEYGLAGVEFRLGARNRFGRSPDNEVVLPGKFISNHHAEITHKKGQYWLEDLGSKNGTFLNGVPLERPAVLANGDYIRIGDITFRLVRWVYEVEPDYRVRPGSS